MADFFADLRDDVFDILLHKVRFKYYAGSVVASDWDDAQAFTQSGVDMWYSGLALPVKNKWGSDEAVLMQQGKLTTSDKIIYVQGDANVTAPSGGAIKVGVGSPTTTEHFLINDGVQAWPPTGETTYFKMWGRELPLGSFIGEF